MLTSTDIQVRSDKSIKLDKVILLSFCLFSGGEVFFPFYFFLFGFFWVFCSFVVFLVCRRTILQVTFFDLLSSETKEI